jgi:hypothetical protein
MRIKHKKLVVVIGVFAVMAIAGAALAYWTSTGTGSGSAAAGSAGNYTVTATVGTGIHPAGNVAVSGTITNNTSSALEVHTISTDPDVAFDNGMTFDTLHSSCNGGWFHFTGTVTGGTQTLAASGGATPYSGTLSMDESATNQDACQGATITLHVKAA